MGTPKRPGKVTANEPWKPQCKDCLAFFEGECRMNPPAVLWSDIEEDVMYAHPTVPEDHFCLAFTPMHND